MCIRLLLVRAARLIDFLAAERNKPFLNGEYCICRYPAPASSRAYHQRRLPVRSGHDGQWHQPGVRAAPWSCRPSQPKLSVQGRSRRGRRFAIGDRAAASAAHVRKRFPTRRAASERHYRNHEVTKQCSPERCVAASKSIRIESPPLAAGGAPSHKSLLIASSERADKCGLTAAGGGGLSAKGPGGQTWIAAVVGAV